MLEAEKHLRHIKHLLIILLFYFCAGIYANTVSERMLAAYGDGDYSRARQLAKTMPDNPKAKLILAMCRVFDPVRQDMSGGMNSLGKLYRAKDLPVAVWAAAALTYGRVAQLVQSRKEVYGNLASKVNPHQVFLAVIAKVPESRVACTALFFDLTEELNGFGTEKADSAFARLERFCRNFKGKPEYLVPLHLLAEQKYIGLKQDYTAAVKHLDAAYKLGIANPRDAEIALYRIGRIYDVKLRNPQAVGKFYRKFLRKYPESGYAPDVTRFLKTLESRQKDGYGQK